jgi:hypothetical protein
MQSHQILRWGKTKDLSEFFIERRELRFRPAPIAAAIGRKDLARAASQCVALCGNPARLHLCSM